MHGYACKFECIAMYVGYNYGIASQLIIIAIHITTYTCMIPLYAHYMGLLASCMYIAVGTNP